MAHTFNPRTQATLDYTRLNLSKKRNKTHKDAPKMVKSHTFNPSTREVEIGVMWLDGQKYRRQEKTKLIVV